MELKHLENGEKFASGFFLSVLKTGFLKSFRWLFSGLAKPPLRCHFNFVFIQLFANVRVRNIKTVVLMFLTKVSSLFDVFH